MTVSLPVVPNGRAPPKAPKDRHISYSALSLYAMCPLRYHFKYNVGIKEDAVSASLVLGSALHSAIEHHFLALMTGEQLPDHDSLLDIFWDAWNSRDQENIRFAKGDDINSIGRLADRMISAFCKSEFSRPLGEVVAVEEEIRGVLAKDLPELLARLDLIVDEGDCLCVSDFKSARAAWSPDNVYESSTQLLLYHELVKMLADRRPIRLQFAVLTKGKWPELQLHDVPANRHMIDRTKQVAARIWRAIQSEHFYPAPSPQNCATCPYRQPCRNWAG